MRILRKILKSKIFLFLIVPILVLILLWNWPSTPSKYDYGITFSAKYAKELKLDPKETFDALVDDLNIKKVRLVAYWDEIEEVDGIYDFSSLDWQMQKAKEKNLDVILAVGRRVPRWPECHSPARVYEMTWEEQKVELRDYIAKVVNRYKDFENISYWQVENEPFLTVYASKKCGSTIDEDFLDEEIAIVRNLDPGTPILTTDSGNLGLWARAYKRGDAFGSTFYVYLTDDGIGEVKSIANHNYYKFKRLASQILFGKKKTFLIETSMEPWLVGPIIETPIPLQLEFMNINRMDEILARAAKTNFDEQYLWGAEWWYYLEQNGYPEIWEHLKEEVFNSN